MAASKQPPPENMLTCLAELFQQARACLASPAPLACSPAMLDASAFVTCRTGCIDAHVLHSVHVLMPPTPSPLQVSSQKKKCGGFVSPRRFVTRVKAENALFSSYMHQVGGLRWAAGVGGWCGLVGAVLCCVMCV